ncbi:MAG: hypothetical protein IH595_06430, partial [Bacteroidales bacterium]|nr:hypothetical protein [Bacteroidales bacterium]
YIISYLIIYILIITLFTFSILTGYYLLKTNSLKKGIKYSFINQFLQLVQFGILGSGLYFVAGPYLSFGFSTNPNLHLITDFSIFRSSCYISFFAKNGTYVSFNVVAAIILMYLYLVWGYIKTSEKEIADVAQK